MVKLRVIQGGSSSKRSEITADIGDLENLAVGEVEDFSLIIQCPRAFDKYGQIEAAFRAMGFESVQVLEDNSTDQQVLEMSRKIPSCDDIYDFIDEYKSFIDRLLINIKHLYSDEYIENNDIQYDQLFWKIKLPIKGNFDNIEVEDDLINWVQRFSYKCNLSLEISDNHILVRIKAPTLREIINLTRQTLNDLMGIL